MYHMLANGSAALLIRQKHLCSHLYFGVPICRRCAEQRQVSAHIGHAAKGYCIVQDTNE